MSANKLFFIGLAVVAVLYFVAVGGNSGHGDESPATYKTEDQQTALVDKYKGNGLKALADRFDPFAAKIDIFAEIDNNNPPSPDRCKVVGSEKERAIVLSSSDASCLVRLPASDESYRKTALSFNLNEPGTATRGGGMAPQVLDSAVIRRFNRLPPQQVITASAERLQIMLTMNERPSKPGVTVRKANETLKIAVQEKGGLLKLTCLSCDRPIYVRAE